MLIVYFNCMLRKLICFQTIERKSLTYCIICPSSCPSCWIKLLKIQLVHVFKVSLGSSPHFYSFIGSIWGLLAHIFFGVFWDLGWQVGWLVGLFSPSLITSIKKRRKKLKINLKTYSETVLLQSHCGGCCAFGAVARCSAGWRLVLLTKKLAETDHTFGNGCLWKTLLR